MGRPLKDGLDYFPLDTANDDKMDLIEAKFGLEGYAIIIKLWAQAYRLYGYFYPWTEREQLLFCKRLNVDINRVNEVILYAIKIEIFSDAMYKKGVLTSRGMQKRYIEASKRRKEILFFSDLLLVNVDIIPVNVSNKPRHVVFNVYNNPQIEIETKSNRNQIESKVKNSNTTVYTPVIPSYNDGNTVDYTDDDTESIRNRYSSSSSSPIQEKKEENIIIPPSSVAEIEPKTKAIAKTKPESDPLYQAIFQSFIAKAGAFTNYPKEAQAIKRIIKYCEQHAPRYSGGDKIRLAEKSITKYYELTQNGDRFWRGQPFTPSNLSAPGIFDRVLVEIGQYIKQEEYANEIPF